MTTELVILELQAIHCRLKNSNKKVEPNDSFRDLGYDSMDMIEFLLEVETKFHIRISNPVMLAIKSPYDLIPIIIQLHKDE